MLKHGYIDIGFCVIMIVGLLIVMRLRSRADSPKGVGVRLIQLIAVIIIVPIVGVLALEGALSGEGTGTILGAIVGYALGGITTPVPSKD